MTSEKSGINEIEFKRDVYEELLNWKKGGAHKALELSGARQSGKTYILQKFAEENFSQVVYFNMAANSGKRFEEALRREENTDEAKQDDTLPLLNALTISADSFQNDESTIVIIDEIQESPKVYNYIRIFTRKLRCYLAVTGSYLGRLLEKSFFLPAGDLYTVTLETLSFREFTDAFGLQKLYDETDLYGASPDENYQKLRECYDIYSVIGGYPSVLKIYLETKDLQLCRNEQLRLIQLFTNESKRYFRNILDTEMFAKTFNGIALNLIREKQGASDLVEELSDIVYRQESGRVTKRAVNNAISWLHASHIIDYAGKSIDCDYLQIVPNARLYFMDIGMAYYFLSQTGEEPGTVKGIVAENFVYCSLYKKVAKNIAGDQPWFAIYQKTNGELDFYVRSRTDFKDYGIEVKSEDGTGKTAQALLKDGKLDYLYYLKGNVRGGVTDDGKIRTVPLYLADRISFELEKYEEKE